jgi:hypothetical protein
MTSLATRKMVYRILDQYKDAPKWVAFIESMGILMDETDEVLEYLLFRRFFDTAEGVHLDRIGVLLGYARPYVQDPDLIFTFDSYTDTVNIQSRGFGTLADPNIGGQYSSIYGLTTGPLVDDDTYRELLFKRAKAINCEPSTPFFYQWIVDNFGIEISMTFPTPMQIEIEITSGSINVNERYLIESLGPTLPGVSVLITNWS